MTKHRRKSPRPREWDNGTHRRSFLHHLIRAVPVIVIFTALTLVLESRGWFRGFETAMLDTWLILKQAKKPAYVKIVGITNDDYKDLFRGQSPLDNSILRELLRAIAMGQPRVIGVDLDTSSSNLAFEELSHDTSTAWPTIVWARDAILSGEKIQPLDFLGGRHSGAPSGIAALPQDSDGIVRRYRRIFQAHHGAIDSFPWAVTKAWCASLATPHTGPVVTPNNVCGKVGPDSTEADGLKENVILNFAGDRYEFGNFPNFLSASVVLSLSTKPGWQSQGLFKDKIVLLGGVYRAARDVHVTPIGAMDGVQLMGHAVESELQGGGIRDVKKWLLLSFDVLGSVIIVYINYACSRRPGLALLLSLAAIPLIAFGASFCTYWTLAYWANVAPTLIAVFIHQLYDHGRQYLKLYEHFRTAPAR